VLLRTGADPNGDGMWGALFPALGTAAAEGSLNMLLQLLNAGAKIPQSMAMHAAAKFGRLDSVELLLEHGADPAIQDRKGKTLLEASDTLGTGQKLWKRVEIQPWTRLVIYTFPVIKGDVL